MRDVEISQVGELSKQVGIESIELVVGYVQCDEVFESGERIRTQRGYQVVGQVELGEVGLIADDCSREMLELIRREVEFLETRETGECARVDLSDFVAVERETSQRGESYERLRIDRVNVRARSRNCLHSYLLFSYQSTVKSHL